jgi:hypothetical protein
MEPSLPVPPRTIIVVDDPPSDLSFICSVLDAHALPYAVQVLDPDAPAFAPLAPRPPRRLRWPRVLAWGVSLGLLVGLLAEAPWLWLAERLPRGPLRPPPQSDSMTTALLGPVVPAPLPAEVRPPAQSPMPVARAHSTGAALGAPPSRGPRPLASVGRHAASLRSQATTAPRASRDTRVRHPRGRYAPRRPVTLPHLITVRDGAETSTPPRHVELGRAVSTPRPRGAGGAPGTLVAGRS